MKTNTAKSTEQAFKIQEEFLGIKDINANPRKILFTKKEVKDLDSIKKMFRYYEYLGFSQVEDKLLKINKLYELAYGKINTEEFSIAKDTYNSILNKLDDEPDPTKIKREVDEVELKFYPLIPPVVNSLINDMDKKVTKQYVKAVNPEATSSLIESRNKDLQDVLIDQATRLFETSIEDLDEETRKAQLEIFNKSQKIQEYHAKEHRLEIELWANHILNIEDEKYRIKDLKKQLLEKLIVTELPFMEVDFNGSDYKYNPVDERNCFYLKSPLDDDASQYLMFGTFTYSTLDSVISKHKIKPEIAEQLEEWSTILNGQLYMSNRIGDPNDTHQEIQVANLRWMKEQFSVGSASRIGEGSIHQGNYTDSSEVPPNLIRETKIRFKLPRKKGELTYLVNGVKYTEIVDESYKVYIKPDYDLTWTKEKTAQNLINGEHIEWFYETESWTGIKLDIASKNIGLLSTSADFNTIWLSLEKDKIQIKDPFRRFSTILPIHGGKSSQMTDTLSLVEKGAPWQSMYNFLGNRCSNLLATEIGLFYVFNQGMIPTESFDGEWGEHNLLKWGQLAHDFGVAPISTDINQLSGQNQLIMGQGYGQVIDLNKTKDIFDKMALMQRVKQEFYSTIGTSPEQLAEISPYQSGKSVAQGLQRSSNMLHHYYRRVEDIMRRARQTGLFFAKYLQEMNPKDLTYTTNEGARVTFRTLGKDFSLADLAIYVQNDLEDVDKLESLFQLVMNDNTMGADTLEKASMLFAKTSSEVLSKLRILKTERDSKIQQQQEHEQQLQAQQLENQKQLLLDEHNFKAEQAQLDRESEERMAQQKAIGYANDDSQHILDTLTKLKEQQNKEKEHDLRLQDILRKGQESKDKLELQRTKVQSDNISKESIELMRLKQREKEIEAENKRTDAMVKTKINKK